MRVLTFQAKVILGFSDPSAALDRCLLGLPNFIHTRRQYIIRVVHVGMNLLKELKLVNV
jgi:hypothetical protein